MKHALPASRRPQPVLAAGIASALASVLTGMLVAWLARRGLLLPEELTEQLADLVEVGVVAAIGAGGSLWAALWSRARVTPTAAPHAADGTPLQPAPHDEPDAPWDDELEHSGPLEPPTVTYEVAELRGHLYR